MNEFIKLRENNLNYAETYDFSQELLDTVYKEGKTQTISEQIFLERMQAIMDLNKTKALDENHLKNLLLYLGDNPYIDRYAVNAILLFKSSFEKETLFRILHEAFNTTKDNNIKHYHLIDLFIELDYKVLTLEQVETLLDAYPRDFDLLSLVLQLSDHFNYEIKKEQLMNLIEKDMPQTIKIQIFDMIKRTFSCTDLELELIKRTIINDDNKIFMNDYLEFLNGSKDREKNGTIILQSMFYGDFEDSGKGNNGGLAILLKTLGNEISLDERIDRVMTLTVSDVMDKPFMLDYKDNHVFVRLPAYLDRTVPDPFLKRELFIKRSIKNFLKQLNIIPDLFHIRYLDNASMAVAKLSEEFNEKLVLTLAPDPHRNMVDESGRLKDFSFQELQILLNKIKIGDKLIQMSDKVLGIGGKKVNKELLLYFPQFKYHNIEHKIKMIAEGIKTDEDMFKKHEDINSCELSELIGSPLSFCKKPLILNVGRLAGIKGQVNLFKAWANSSLNQSHNLLIIGGDLEKPNEEETEIIEFFNQELEKNPALKEKFFHKGAMHNDAIKRVEISIMKHSFNLPNIYLASSIKEEFGIAILEAMSRGFLIMAPLKGGVKSYITSRDNGFLIDTSSDQTIAKDAEDILYHSDISLNEFQEIQEAGIQTIKDNFSIDKIAKNFTDTYLDLLEREHNEL